MVPSHFETDLPGEQQGRLAVDALEEAQRVDVGLPARLEGDGQGRLGHLLDALGVALYPLEVEGEGAVGALLAEVCLLRPCHERHGPHRLEVACRRPLVPGPAVPSERCGGLLLGALERLHGVVSRAHEVADGLAFLIGDPDDGELALLRGQHLREQAAGVLPVGLALPVVVGARDGGDRHDVAVDAEGPQAPAQLEARVAGLVGGVVGGGELGPHPFGDLGGGGAVAEPARLLLAGGPVEALDDDRPRMDVHAEDGGVLGLDGILRHQETPSTSMWHGGRAFVW